MNCELCGLKSAALNADIEGTMMNVCRDCSRFGTVQKSVRIVVKPDKLQAEEPILILVSEFGSIVKRAREKLGLRQDEMAKRLNERESLLHQIESEHFKPNISLARKLERELKIKLLEEAQDSKQDQPKPRNTARTFGDLMKSNK